MSADEIYKMSFEHIIDSPNYRFVCARINASGRIRLFKIYQDGTVTTYERGDFVELAPCFGKHIRLALGATKQVPTFYSRTLN